ncbi:hypothetical protein BH10PSE1_BH10PSE1_24200 [soil metagenome]
MSEDPSSGARDGAVLSQALKAIRRDRGMTPGQTARAMHMAPRTYQRFEAGDTKVNLDHIHRFAQATRSDPHAIFMAISIGSPRHALRGCDNQIDTILTIGVKELDDVLGDRIRDLDRRTIVTAVTTLIDTLAGALDQTDPTRRWLEEGAQDLAARRPQPGR